LSLYRERDYRLRTRCPRFLHLCQQLPFQVVGIRHHLARPNLLVRRTMKTQVADSQAILRPHGRTKGATGHRPRIIEFAQACLGIEHWTGLIVGKFREAFCRPRSGLEHLGIEGACFYVPWKLGCQSLN